MRSSVVAAFLLFAGLYGTAAFGIDKARAEAKVDAAVKKFGVAGRNVIVAIIDRGIDWKNNDFRNPDGTTRIEAIFDLTDDSGANAANNPYKMGTLYSREQINTALSANTELAHRDAVGPAADNPARCVYRRGTESALGLWQDSRLRRSLSTRPSPT